jgi:tripartite tricarboxylate transporter family receptor
MKLPRRRFLRLAAGALAMPAVSRVASAQAYPSRPVRIVVAFAAGGSSDIGARLIGQWLQERLGQPFVIENRPGAATNIATETVVRAPADGYTLLMIGPSSTINATLYDKLNFVFLRDIAPIAGTIRHSMSRLVLAGRSDSFTAEGDSMSPRPACRVSPVGSDEKSSLNWMFSRLSLSRLMSYLPLLSFGPSDTRSRLGLSVDSPFRYGVPH